MKHPEHPPRQDSKWPSPLAEVHCICADLGSSCLQQREFK